MSKKFLLLLLIIILIGSACGGSPGGENPGNTNTPSLTASRRYAAICLTNFTDIDIDFVYSWGGGDNPFYQETLQSRYQKNFFLRNGKSLRF